MASSTRSCAASPPPEGHTSASKKPSDFELDALAYWSRAFMREYMRDTAAASAAEEAFEAANPDIDLVVEIMDATSYARKLPVMIASGTAPDLFEAGLERAASTGHNMHTFRRVASEPLCPVR